MWEAIKWSADHGFEKLCFDGAEPENEGLIQFKQDGESSRTRLLLQV